MLIGYARVSTDDQNLDLQRDALRLAGCEKIYEDRMSGAKAARPGLTLALEVARAGDVLTVWRLDRLGRSLHDLILLGRKLDELGIGLMSVQEKIDTSSSGGKLVFHMFGALADDMRSPRLCGVAGPEPIRPAIRLYGTPHYPAPGSECAAYGS